MRSLNVRTLFLALGPLLAIACTGSGDDGDTTDLALVSNVGCSIARGAFVSKASANSNGEISVTCPAVHGVTFNGDTLAGESLSAFKVKPHEGINVLHVERTEGEDN